MAYNESEQASDRPMRPPTLALGLPQLATQIQEYRIQRYLLLGNEAEETGVLWSSDELSQTLRTLAIAATAVHFARGLTEHAIMNDESSVNATTRAIDAKRSYSVDAESHLIMGFSRAGLLNLVMSQRNPRLMTPRVRAFTVTREGINHAPLGDEVIIPDTLPSDMSSVPDLLFDNPGTPTISYWQQRSLVTNLSSLIHPQTRTVPASTLG
jgi:hypothetical protein